MSQGSWKGNPNNPVPNPVQEAMSRSEKRVNENRSLPVRRDTDKQKNFSITMEDIDETIAAHLGSMKLIVTDEGNAVKVPIVYGSMEKWVSAKRDGYLRDKQGKIQLPMMIFQRTSTENNDDIEIFKPYVKYPVIVKHSSKNKYTQFAVLNGRNEPVHEVYNVAMVDHVILTYQCIMWAEYTPHLNKVLETIKYNTKDYWGSPRGFRFRVQAEGFTNTTEVVPDDDRVVKLEWNLITNGYILPEEYQILDRQYPTTEKLFTPKKIVIGTEVVQTGFELAQENASKWKSQKYPNLDKGTEPPAPPISLVDGAVSSSLV